MAIEKMIGENGQEISIDLDESTLRHILALAAEPNGTVSTKELHEEGFFLNVVTDVTENEL